MRYPAQIVIATIVLVGLSSSVATAGNITYQISDNPLLQQGNHIQGTITTDGTIGTLGVADIVSWQFSLLSPTYVTLGTGTSAEPILASVTTVLGNVVATPSLITLSGQAYLSLDDRTTGAVYEISVISGGLLDEGDWYIDEYSGNWGSDTSGYFGVFDYAVSGAAVPEPTSLTLALLGLGVLSGAGLARGGAGECLGRPGASEPTRKPAAASAQAIPTATGQPFESPWHGSFKSHQPVSDLTEHLRRGVPGKVLKAPVRSAQVGPVCTVTCTFRRQLMGPGEEWDESGTSEMT